MAFRSNKSFRDIIDDLGLSTGIQICLDAGDIASYPGSGQKWLDRGQGYDFFLGTTAGVDATDPTFTGTAGDLKDTTYWLFDGGDFFRYDTTNEVWMQNIHKDNAKLTILAWFFTPVLAVGGGICGTNAAAAANVGFNCNVRAANTLRFNSTNGAVSSILDSTATVKIGWNFCAVSVDEGAASGITQINEVQETFSYSYTAPSASADAFTMEIGALGNAAGGIDIGGRLGAFMMWNRALSAAELMSLYQYPGLVFSDTGGQRQQNRMVSY